MKYACLAATLLACVPVALAAQGGAPAEPVRVTIHVVDSASRRGIERMEVRVAGLPAATSDRRGDVALAAVPAGSHTFAFTHPQYGSGTGTLTVTAPGPAEFELPIPRRAVTLEPLQVNVRRLTASDRDARSSGRRQNVLTRADIEARRGSARDVGDLVRTFPALQVSEIQHRDSRSVKEICITERSGARTTQLTSRAAIQERQDANRRGASMPARRERALQDNISEQCEGVAVAVDDRLVAGQAGEFIKNFALDQIESVHYLRGSEAAARFGGAGGNGVILIYTRGNGPTVQQ